MQRIYSSKDVTEIDLLNSLLEENGIPCLVKNQFVGILRGDVPFTDTWPEVWVERDEDADAARALIENAQKNLESPGPKWTCPNCEEVLESQFESCWKCGTGKPEAAAEVVEDLGADVGGDI